MWFGSSNLYLKIKFINVNNNRNNLVNFNVVSFPLDTTAKSLLVSDGQGPKVIIIDFFPSSKESRLVFCRWDLRRQKTPDAEVQGVQIGGIGRPFIGGNEGRNIVPQPLLGQLRLVTGCRVLLIGPMFFYQSETCSMEVVPPSGCVWCRRSCSLWTREWRKRAGSYQWSKVQPIPWCTLDPVIPPLLAASSALAAITLSFWELILPSRVKIFSSENTVLRCSALRHLFMRWRHRTLRRPRCRSSNPCILRYL